MKQALDVLMFFRYAPPAQRPMVIKAIADLEQAIKQEALNLKAENARELGLDYEPVPVKTYSGGKAWPVQTEWVGLTDVDRVAVQYEAHKKKLTPLEFMELHEAKIKEKNSKG
jgi:hypothetical protein